ncbi:MAG: TAT-variant-translocated molybdopterin oxidoreductase [Candidatus Polarisedimenticolia bacterium]
MSELTRIRRRLDSLPQHQWRSLEEVAGTDAFRDLLHREFPENASEWLDPAGRREFLRLMGASLALAGLTACTRQPAEAIVPYVRAAEEIVPGQPLYFATAFTLAGLGQGVLVESHMGRPTKVEGNPQHPASLGATDVYSQAEVLGLYDPDRSQVAFKGGTISTWSSFVNELAVEMERQAASGGAGLRVLTGTVTSPTLAALLREMLARFPNARWHQYEPAAGGAALAGSMLAFGRPASTRYQLDKADVIVSLDADFMTCMAGSVRYAHDASLRRRAEAVRRGMNRIYVVESEPSPTGSVADHRVPLAPDEIVPFALDLAAAVGLPMGVTRGRASWSRFVEAMASDLKASRGAGVVLAGPGQPAFLHALAHAINGHLGNTGSTVLHAEPVEARPEDQHASLAALAADMQAGQVRTLLILGGNPAYTAPAGIPFARALEKVPFAAHLSLQEDETSALCLWHLPESHTLEGWGDARAYDGTVTIQQPLIAPLYASRSAVEMMATLLGHPDAAGHDLVRETWRGRPEAAGHEGGFEAFWRRSLHDGVVAGTQLPPVPLALNLDRIRQEAASARPAAAEGLHVIFRPDAGVFDGRFGNNGWLQELPRPFTSLTWDNAALMAPSTAERLGLANEDVVEVTLQQRSVHAPVWILPGMAGDTVSLTLGYGRTRAGRVGNGRGYDAYGILPGPIGAYAGIQLRRTGERASLARTQTHHSMEGRGMVRWAALSAYQESPGFAQHGPHGGEPDVTMYPEWPYEGYAWGMTIDLGACHGCNACVIACQSENNVPVVGKDQVLVGREMHWIRVDQYFEGDLDDPKIFSQPVPCMHCENAPCEPVCPVAATTHSEDGLNQMVYNRCVGTRYCSNNCPYKVRRFNFLLYQDWNSPSLALMRNPDVTVRSRGIMEKCTYCVQRINAARIQARTEDRRIRDGEATPACAAACPSQAIVFGDVNDPESRVHRLKRNSLNYGMLAELNTRPRTTYLARVTNPNPALSQESPGHVEG